MASRGRRILRGQVVDAVFGAIDHGAEFKTGIVMFSPMAVRLPVPVGAKAKLDKKPCPPVDSQPR